MIFIHFAFFEKVFVVDVEPEQIPLNVKTSASLVLEVLPVNVLKDRYGVFHPSNTSTMAEVFEFMEQHYAYARDGV